jgi:hypothetical protein
MFPALRPFFKIVVKILNRNVCQIPPTDDLMSSTSEKRPAFSTLFKFGNSQKGAGARSGEYGGWSLAETSFPAENCDA